MKGRLALLGVLLAVPLSRAGAKGSDLADPGWLPPGWIPRETTALGPSAVGSLPALAPRAAGRVLLAARTTEGDGDLFLVEVDAPLRIDETAREALALSAPDALRHLWGVEVEVAWVDLVAIAGVDTLQLQGRLTRRGRVLRLAVIPQGERHLVVVLTWPEQAAGELASQAQRLLLALPRPRPAPEPFWTASMVTSCALVVALALIALARMRR